MEPGGPAADGAEPMQQSEEGSIASREQLEAFCSLPAEQRWPPLDAAQRGVLAETALHGRQRYEWHLLAPLLHSLVDSVMGEFRHHEEEAGPPRPPPPGFDSVEALSARLHGLLDGHEAAPFTLQRLCEVLLEPRKQYARLDKLALAIEKLLMVTSTRQPDQPTSLPPPPTLASLRGVNNNPPSPYLQDGRPPAVLDQQQHQALLQQQAAAMAAAQQQQHLHLQQQAAAAAQQGGQLGAGLPNGMRCDRPPPLEPADGEGEGAGAEAMQLDAPPGPAAAGPPAITPAEVDAAKRFVESALADEESAAVAAAAAGSAAGSVNDTPASPGTDHQAAATGGTGAAAEQQQRQQQPEAAVERQSGQAELGSASLPVAAAGRDAGMAGMEEQPAAAEPVLPAAEAAVGLAQQSLQQEEQQGLAWQDEASLPAAQMPQQQ